MARSATARVLSSTRPGGAAATVRRTASFRATESYRAHDCRMAISAVLANWCVARSKLSVAPVTADLVRTSYAAPSTTRRHAASTAPMRSESFRARDIRDHCRSPRIPSIDSPFETPIAHGRPWCRQACAPLIHCASARGPNRATIYPTFELRWLDSPTNRYAHRRSEPC